MRKILIIILLLSAASYVFQEYIKPSFDEENKEEEIEFIYDEELPPIPETCRKLSGELENAFYGVKSADFSQSQLVVIHRKFVSCLRDEGFADDEIEGTVAEIKFEADKKLRQDGYIK